MDFMIYVWIALFVVLVIIEAATVQLVTIWFAAGALAAFIAALLDVQFWLQLLIFVAVSVLALALTRPLVKKMK
ncbi:MAG TPA: NfeD family protein, partial [Clostridiales bacterium]|nr:NfeD family protein [Clostridiales bacterium]